MSPTIYNLDDWLWDTIFNKLPLVLKSIRTVSNTIFHLYPLNSLIPIALVKGSAKFSFSSIFRSSMSPRSTISYTS